MKVLITQLCPVLCDPMDCSPPGSSVREIFQARIVEWVAIPFFRESVSPALQADSSLPVPPRKPILWEQPNCISGVCVFILSKWYYSKVDFAGGGHGNPLQYYCLENPMDRGAWQATLHRVTKSQTRLKQPSMLTKLYCIWPTSLLNVMNS